MKDNLDKQISFDTRVRTEAPWYYCYGVGSIWVLFPLLLLILPLLNPLFLLLLLFFLIILPSSFPLLFLFLLLHFLPFLLLLLIFTYPNIELWTEERDIGTICPKLGTDGQTNGRTDRRTNGQKKRSLERSFSVKKFVFKCYCLNT